jgi:tetratricopeptide (TPR) repeat protein
VPIWFYDKWACNKRTRKHLGFLRKKGVLRVPARTSSFSFKGEERNIREIGEKLNVSTVLEGSVQKSGNRIRIMAQLIDVADESALWSADYNRELEDIFSIQEEIALAIVEELKPELLGSEKKQLQKRYTENVEAFNHYSQGLFYWNKRTAESLNTAIQQFKLAIDLDPEYALAYVGLADCYNLLSLYGNVHSSETFPKAKQAASRAIELNPNYATAHFWYAENLMIQERFDEALHEMNLALELDPVSPIINSSLSMVYLYNSQPELALQQVRKTIEMHPSFAHARSLACGIHLILKQFPESIEEGKKAVELSGRSPFYLAWLGYAYAVTGMEDESRKIVEELSEIAQTRYVSALWFAVVNTGLNEKDKAFKWLDKAYEEHYEVLVLINVSPFFDPIRDDPRFAELLEKVGLSEVK